MKNTLYRLLLLPWLLLAAWGAQAQAPAWTGAVGLTPGTAGNNVVQAVATNAAGDVFIAGTFNGSATFGTLPALTSQGGTDDMYVAKWSAANSNWVWAVSGGSSTDADGAYGIAVNGANVYVTGSYNGTATISGSSLTAVSSGFDLFVAKYVDGGASVSNGGAVSGGGGGSDRGTCVTFNGTTVYVGGYYTGATTATISGSSLTGASNNNVFLAKYTDTGTGLNSLQNSNAVGAATTSTERATSIAVNGTTIYLGGYFNGASLPIGGTTLTNNAAGSQDLFIARYTDAGTLTAGGAVSGGGGGGDRVTGLAVNGTTVYATGYFDSAPASIAGTNNLSATGGTNSVTGNNDIYVAKYTDTGSGLTGAGAVSNTGSSVEEQSAGIAAIGSTIYITGYFSGATTIAGTALSAPTGGSDVFVAKYSDTGSLQGQGAISGGTGTANPPDAGTAIAASGTQVVAAGVKDPASAATFGSFTVPSGPTGFFARVGQSATTVTSIVPASTNPTNAASVQFTVTFASSVSGLTAANFTTANGGSVAGSSVTSVSAGPGTTYTVTVNTGSGSGTLGLTLANSTGITPSVSNVPFTGTPLYTIDKTAPVPTITSGTAANGGSTSTSPIAYTVTFSETVTGFIASEVTVGNGSLSGFTAVSGTTYTFNVTPTANGAVTVSVAAGVAQDAVGNNNVVSTPNPYSITYTAPTATVTSISKLAPTAAQSATGTATTQVQFTVAFSAAVSGVTISNFSLTTSGLSGTGISSVSGSGTTYTVTANTGTGNGTLQLNVANATGITPSVTNTPFAGTSAVYTITKSFAAAPTLLIQGTGGTGTDVTAFVDVAQVLSGGSAFANGLQNGSFETHNALANGNYGYNPTGAVWTFNAQSGIAESGSAFTPVTPIPNGIAVAFVQSNGSGNGQFQQNLAVPTGSSYQVSFQAAQRNCCTTGDQALNVFLNGVFIGTVQPANNNAYTTFTSATFSVTAPALTATVSTTSASPTSTSPIPFQVSFSQSVGTTFTASDVTVSNGSTLNAASFSGSGSGPYTFTVTPPAAGGTVTVSVAAGVAQDANNTNNSASNSVSVQYQTQTATPVLTSPTNGGTTNGTPIFAGTAAANSTITFYLNGQNIGTTTANGSGNFGVQVGSTLPSGSYTLYVTAQVSGQAVSNNSPTINFTIDSTRPTPTVSTTSASPTSTAPIPFTVTFSETVTGFTSGSVTVTNGTVNTFSGSGTTYNLTITPSGTGTVTVSVPQNVAQDGVGNQNTASNSVSVQYNQPTTATPVLTRPVNNSFVRTNQPEYRGTSAPNAFIFIYRATGSGSFALTDTTIANGLGNFHKFSDAVLADGQYSVYVTATTSGSATSANSNTNTFTVDTTAPTVTLTSGTVNSGSTTSTSPVSFTATFSEPVTGFTSAGILVGNGTVTSGPTTGANNTYTFQVTPSGGGNVTVRVLAGAAQDQANNNNTSSTQYSFTFMVPTITVAPASLPNGTQGTAYSTTFSASGGAAPYTYAISGTPPNGLTLSVATLSGTPTASGTYNFRITATDNSAAPGPYSGFRDYTLVIVAPAVTSVSWNGNQNTNWFEPLNWTPNTVPDATIDAFIPTSPSGGRFPVIAANAAQANARNVSIASNASLSMNANTLTIAANLTSSGVFNGFTGSGGAATGGTVVLGSSAAASISGAGSVNFWNLTVGASGTQMTITGGTSVRRLLTLNGNLATSNLPLTLVSDVNGTAMVVNNGSAVVNGTTTVQRYIAADLNAARAYRHASAPISNATIGSLNIAGGFQVEISQAAVFNSSATPGAVRPFPNVYGYNQARLATVVSNYTLFDRGWFAPTALTDPMTQGKGYTVSTTANQTWNFTGTLGNDVVTQTLARNSGPTQTIADGSGLHLVGNPYPAPLDLSQVADADRTNVDRFIAVFAAGGSGNGYAYYTNGLGSTGPVVPLGQGFFVRVTQGQTNGSLTFRNAYRAQTYQSPTYHRTAETRPVVRLALQAVGSTETDDAFVYFESGATAAFDSQFDAPKIVNPSGLNVSSSFAGSESLAINGLTPLGTSQLVVPLAVGVPAAGSYTLKAAELLNLGSTPTYLRDRQTGAVIDLARQASYQFSVSDASALLTGRFELVFSPQAPLATSQAALAQQVALYPNPATGSASVELPAQLGRSAVTATLVDAVGREVRTVSLPAQGAVAHRLDLRELPSGVYLLRLHTSAGTLVKKLTVE